MLVSPVSEDGDERDFKSVFSSKSFESEANPRGVGRHDVSPLSTNPGEVYDVCTVQVRRNRREIQFLSRLDWNLGLPA
jgi:hypothetical protein